jgi:hypothetical protein
MTTTSTTAAGDRPRGEIPAEPSGRDLLRHTFATLAYRAAKAVRGAPEDFAEFRITPGSRTPGEILAHMCDLLDWAGWLARGEHRWTDTKPADWNADVARFFSALQQLEDYVAGGAPLYRSAEQLFQGPIADALTHVGQLAMLRRAAGSPIRGESYARAEIVRGRVGAEQSAPRAEFG